MPTVKRVQALAALIPACGLTLIGCSNGQQEPAPVERTAAVAQTEPDVAPHESGPESPISLGLEVPQGATQLGPLMRVRSGALIGAYRPELRSAQAQKRAEEALEAQENDATPTPSPTPGGPPSDDSFTVLDEQPRPDTVVSFIRIDGDPSKVTRRMIAQVAALLPEAKLDPNDLKKVCRTSNQRVQRCLIDVRGKTSEQRLVRVRVEVNPGRLKTRTSPPSSLRNPVMVVHTQYIGDPVAGQARRPSNKLEGVADIDDIPEKSALIWPRMDVDARQSTRVAAGFVPPEDSTILLSGFEPSFVVLNLGDSARRSDVIAAEWARKRVDGAVTKDVVEDLNEVSTTYSGRSKGGAFYRSTHVMSARGNYVTMVVYPNGVL